MMIGILSANLDVTIEQAMTKLMDIGSTQAIVSETDGSNLPQVHALNSLTAIFKTSYLSHSEKKLETYIPQCLQLAADCLKSEMFVDPFPTSVQFIRTNRLMTSPAGRSATAASCFYAVSWTVYLGQARARR